MTAPHLPFAYVPRRPGRSRFVPVRGLQYHVTCWGDDIDPAQPPLVMLHGWMDVGASFQFVVDALPQHRYVVALDWRGFGRTQAPADTYWFADYLGDLDVLLDTLLPGRTIDLLGHSMGGNVAMLYAGVRPQRLRRLVNLEGFGMPRSRPQDAPARYAQWLDQLREPPALGSYDSVDGVSRRLMKNNPRLAADKAAWLALQWSERRGDGRWHLRAEPGHKGVAPQLYQADEVLAVWQRIEAPLLWIDGALTDMAGWWGQRYGREEFEARLATVRAPVERQRLAASGHMLHHDEPEALAAHIERFLAAAA
ncbi:alpha/beta fold hydrolase [Aquincola sp. MAHUQ-54]|uniref:Alpha/beta fold hydrolase n=1 Tax=Aquincola agrisoli TaxID=3119538 RepID=A0AAW9Q926_9BURK